MQQQEQKDIRKVNLDRQLKEVVQQYHAIFNATKEQLVQSDKGTNNISLENETHHKWSKPRRWFHRIWYWRQQNIASMEKSHGEIVPWCNNWGDVWLNQAFVKEMSKKYNIAY